MAIKDFFKRISGKDDGQRRGTRGARSNVRGRDDATVQIASPMAQAPPPAARPPAPPSAAPYAPVTPTPMPPSAAPSRAPDPTPAPQRQSSEQPTQYMQVPKFDSGPVAGVIVGIEGELEGEVFKVRSGENKIGRSESCDVVLASVKISREHATILYEEGIFAIATLSDKNATFVNDEPIDASELSDGDVIRMGSSTFRFRTIEAL